jgi:tryptophan halogenase
MSDNRLKDIVIVGGGSAGWMTAGALSCLLDNQDVSITLIESESIGTVGVGEATIPDILLFNRMLGISEDEFIRATDATFKLGIEFVNWGQKGERYFHPFGEHGADMQGIDFHQFWLAARDQGDNLPFETYSLCAHAAKSGKFRHPDPNPKSVMSHINYAYHFDATAYAAYLRNYAEQRSTKRVEGIVETVTQSPGSGEITSVTLQDGTEVTGDFFFDCTGFRSLLMRQTLDVGFVDWSHWLPCNSAQTVATEHTGPLPSHTRATAHEAGWQWRIPTQGRVGNGHVYSTDFTDDETARERLIENLEGEMRGDPRTIRFTTGRLEHFWEKNCVSIGLASGFLEPLESTSLYLIQVGITKFISLFPGKGVSAVIIDEYNRQLTREFEQVRDFLIAHYNVTLRDDSPFWNHVRTMDIPDSLAHKMDLFKAAGRVFRNEDELFSKPSWTAVLLGQNVIPDTYDPIVGGLPEGAIAHSLSSMRQAMTRATEAMPTHTDYLQRYARGSAA